MTVHCARSPRRRRRWQPSPPAATIRERRAGRSRESRVCSPSARWSRRRGPSPTDRPARAFSVDHRRPTNAHCATRSAQRTTRAVTCSPPGPTPNSRPNPARCRTTRRRAPSRSSPAPATAVASPESCCMCRRSHAASARVHNSIRRTGVADAPPLPGAPGSASGRTRRWPGCPTAGTGWPGSGPARRMRSRPRPRTRPPHETSRAGRRPARRLQRTR